MVGAGGRRTFPDRAKDDLRWKPFPVVSANPLLRGRIRPSSPMTAALAATTRLFAPPDQLRRVWSVVGLWPFVGAAVIVSMHRRKVRCIDDLPAPRMPG